MNTYQLSPTGKYQSKVYVRFATAFVVALAFFPAILAIPSFKNMDISVLWIFLILLPIFPIVAYFMARRYLKTLSDIRVTIDGNQLVLDRPGRRQVAIEREDVKSVLVDEQGLRVLSTDPQNSIFVPSGLENFEQFKSELAIWSPNAEFKTTSLKTTLYWILVGVALLLALYFTKNSMVGWLFVAFLAVVAFMNAKDTFQTILHTKSKWKRIQAIIGIVMLLYVLASFLLGGAK
jgi:hypothetical protein